MDPSDRDRTLRDDIRRLGQQLGDTLVRRRSLKDDNQLRRAMEIMRKGTTQKEIFTAAAAEPASKPGVARRSGP